MESGKAAPEPDEGPASTDWDCCAWASCKDIRMAW